MTGLDARIVNSWWLAILLWAAAYSADYYLTLAGARLYRSPENTHLTYEGSYELTPYFQADIDALRPISLRFLVALALSCLALATIWFLDARLLQWGAFFAFAIGALVLRFVAVALRHVRNISLFRATRNAPDVLGQIRYPRWLSLRISAVELFGFAAFLLSLGLLNGSYSLLGGALSTAVLGLQHGWRSTRRKA